ncbi:cytochrome P450 2G1-like [Gastrophryne carolinensis]
MDEGELFHDSDSSGDRPGGYDSKPGSSSGEDLWLPDDTEKLLSVLSKVYGSVFSIHMGMKRMVVPKGYNTVKDALVNHANEFGERAFVPIFNKLDNGMGVDSLVTPQSQNLSSTYVDASPSMSSEVRVDNYDSNGSKLIMKNPEILLHRLDVVFCRMLKFYIQRATKDIRKTDSLFMTLDSHKKWSTVLLKGGVLFANDPRHINGIKWENSYLSSQSLEKLSDLGFVPVECIFVKLDSSRLMLAKVYGPVFSVRMGTTKMIVLAGYQAVKSALVNNAEEFGERKNSRLFQDLDKGFALRNYYIALKKRLGLPGLECFLSYWNKTLILRDNLVSRISFHVDFNFRAGLNCALSLNSTMELGLSAATYIVVALTFLYILNLIRTWKNGEKYLPGPRALPLIGNIHIVNLTKPQFTFMELAKKYGPVFRVQMGPKKVVVLAGYEAVKDALVNYAEEFEGRGMDKIFEDIDNNLAPCPMNSPLTKHLCVSHRVPGDTPGVEFISKKLFNSFWTSSSTLWSSNSESLRRQDQLLGATERPLKLHCLLGLLGFVKLVGIKLKNHMDTMANCLPRSQASDTSILVLTGKAKAHHMSMAGSVQNNPHYRLSFSSGKNWRVMRRFTLTALRDFGMGKSSVEQKVIDECAYIIQSFQSFKGKPFDDHIFLKSAVANIIVSILLGHRIDYEDPQLPRLLNFVTNINRCIGSPTIVVYNMFPCLRFLPGAHKTVLKHINELKEFIMKTFVKHMRNLDENDQRSFIDAYLVKQKEEANHPDSFFHQENLICLIRSLFTAGVETTSVTLQWGLLLMMNYPDIQAKIQEEISSVIGFSQPMYSHRTQMPYTNAVIHEIQRFADIVPLGLPHETTKDVTFKGYFLPKGTYIIPLLTSVLRDKTQFERPDEFYPNHFLDSEGNFLKKDAFMPFSAGRRVCVGETLARMELFIYFTSLLQKFTIHCPPGVSSFDLKPGAGFVKMPKKHTICAVPRF